MSGRKPTALEYPPCPPELAHHKRQFYEIYHGSPLSFTEIDAYYRLTSSAVDARLLRDIEFVYNMAINGKPIKDILAAFGFE